MRDARSAVCAGPPCKPWVHRAASGGSIDDGLRPCKEGTAEVVGGAVTALAYSVRSFLEGRSVIAKQLIRFGSFHQCYSNLLPLSLLHTQYKVENQTLMSGTGVGVETFLEIFKASVCRANAFLHILMP